MGMVYLPRWLVDIYGKLAGKYTSPTDPTKININQVEVESIMKH